MLFTMLSSAHLRILPVVMEVASEVNRRRWLPSARSYHSLQVVERGTAQWRTAMADTLRQLIARNYDYTRKLNLVQWYLRLLERVGLNDPARNPFRAAITINSTL